MRASALIAVLAFIGSQAFAGPTGASLNYSPSCSGGNVLMTLCAGGTAGTFTQTVTCSGVKSGIIYSFTGSLKNKTTDATALTFKITTSKSNLSFTNASPSDKWDITISVPSGTPDGAYAVQLGVDPSITGVGNANGTCITVTVHNPPAVTSNPSNSTVCSGSVASFSAAASGTAPSVQWQVKTSAADWTNVSGATSTTYSFTTASDGSENGNEYRAMFSNECNTATTAAATLTVNVAPTIAGPADASFECFSDVPAASTSDASVTGRPSPDVTVEESATGTGNAASPYVITRTYTASNSCGSVSATQTITVIDDVAPTITAPADIVWCASANATDASIDPGTPVTGDNCAVASVTNDAPAGNVFPVGTTTVTWTVTDAAGNTASATQNITVNVAVGIAADPASSTVCDGSTAFFSSDATGVPAPTVQWQVSTDGSSWSNLDGETGSSLSFTAATANNGAMYRALWTNSCGSVASAIATLTVNPRPTVSSISVAYSNGGDILSGSGETATLTTTLTGTGPWNVTWSDGATATVETSPFDRVVEPTVTTTYSITSLSDANCTANDGDMAASASVAVTPSATLTLNVMEQVTTGSGGSKTTTTYPLTFDTYRVFSDQLSSHGSITVRTNYAAYYNDASAPEVKWYQLSLDANTTKSGTKTPAAVYTVLVPANNGLVVIGSVAGTVGSGFDPILGDNIAALGDGDTGSKDMTYKIVNGVRALSKNTGTETMQSVLYKNYPDPFTAHTTVGFTLATDAPVTLKVYDAIGREVATALDGVSYHAGTYAVSIDGSHLAPGVYTYRMTAGDFASTGMMTIMK